MRYGVQGINKHPACILGWGSRISGRTSAQTRFRDFAQKETANGPWTITINSDSSKVKIWQVENCTKIFVSNQYFDDLSCPLSFLQFQIANPRVVLFSFALTFQSETNADARTSGSSMRKLSGRSSRSSRSKALFPKHAYACFCQNVVVIIARWTSAKATFPF